MTSLRRYLAGLSHEMTPDLSWVKTANVRSELVSGQVGALLVIPQAITFAYLAGVPPVYGLYCAVFVGFLASFLGNSAMVGGPNTAVSIMLSMSVMPYAGRGSPLYVEYVLALSLMVGLIQLVIWLLRGGEVFRYFSPAAITGIKTGVGVLLITSSLEGALGLGSVRTQFFYEKFYVVISGWGDLVNPCAAVISGVTVATGLVLKPFLRRTYVVFAVLAGCVIGAGIYLYAGPVASNLELLGHVTFHAFPFMIPNLTAQHLQFVEEVFPNAVAIAVLGLAQSLVIARDLEARTGPVNLHKEVFAQGASNALAPFCSTFAGSGSFNRTSIALEMGALTPLSGIVAAVAVVVIAWGLGPLLTYVPMPAIAGILAIVGIGMIQRREIVPLLRNRVDGTVFVLTLAAVSFLGLEAGLLVAVLSSVAFFVAGVSKVQLLISEEDGAEHIHVKGNLFYASFDRLARHLRRSPAAHTVLDLSHVPFCDSAASDMIESVQKLRARHGGRLDVRPSSSPREAPTNAGSTEGRT
ncbi:MAG: hypothetical protein GC151_04670 [Betaproteobacteria bacterium]|nr:hypothetical protein [Betaproteobacteria bacterium]